MTVRAAGGPGGWQPPEDAEGDHSMIIAGTFFALVVLALVVVALLMALWKLKLEPSCAREGQVSRSFQAHFPLLQWEIYCVLEANSLVL